MITTKSQQTHSLTVSHECYCMLQYWAALHQFRARYRRDKDQKPGTDLVIFFHHRFWEPVHNEPNSAMTIELREGDEHYRYFLRCLAKAADEIPEFGADVAEFLAPLRAKESL